MMSEISEIFSEIKHQNQRKRASNRINSTKLLIDENIEFTNKNNGAHLIVKCFDHYIDFWPGTGKWISRIGRKGRGVFNLIRHIKNYENTKNDNWRGNSP